jgi:hypothetical protein
VEELGYDFRKRLSVVVPKVCNIMYNNEILIFMTAYVGGPKNSRNFFF